MATKSHKKKKPSALNPSIGAKAPSSDEKPSNPQKPAEEREAATAKKPKKQKASNEIDDIFQATAKSSKKRKPQQQQEEEEEEAEGAKKPKKGRAEGGSTKKSKKESRGKFREPGDEVGEEKRPRRRTNDGLTIYSADELGFGKADAGGTPLCPFDCDCCF